MVEIWLSPLLFGQLCISAAIIIDSCGHKASHWSKSDITGYRLVKV